MMFEPARLIRRALPCSGVCAMAAIATAAMVITPQASAQLILNEANAVGPGDGGQFIQTGGSSKPYEGYDYGIMPYSGNDNSEVDPTNPGNPFPSNLAGATFGTPPLITELGNGWSLANPTGFGRIRENAGDWVELVVTEDLTDARGWRLEWDNTDPDSGFIEFSDDPIWNNLRAGTIITISEENSFDEIRDAAPSSFPGTGIHDTGFDYDLSTDTSFNPIGSGTPDNPGPDADWHRHFWLPEDTTDQGNTDTQYFNAGSDIKVDNDDWRMRIVDAQGQTVQDWVGEAVTGWGTTGIDDEQAGGVNNQEVIMLRADPDEPFTIADYEDVDWSTFGTENVLNLDTESYPDGVQDFSGLRAWLTNTPKGDMNQDGAVTNGDIALFVLALTAKADYDAMFPGMTADIVGDLNGDGSLTNGDIAGFLELLTGTNASASAVPEPASLAMLAFAGGMMLVRPRRRV